MSKPLIWVKYISYVSHISFTTYYQVTSKKNIGTRCKGMRSNYETLYSVIETIADLKDFTFFEGPW